MDARQEIKSLKKALRALTFLNRCNDATVTQVAKAIGVPRTTAYRLLETLASEGYVEKQLHSDFYRITSLVQRLAAGFQDEDLMIEVAKPLIIEAGKELGWAICLATPRANEMVVRINTDHSTPLALERYTVGSSIPLLNATAGYCYLAHCSEQEREAMLSVALNAKDQQLFVAPDPEAIRRRIVDAHEQGFCNLEFDVYREGNVGVPLLLAGKPVGGIVMRYIKSALKNTGRQPREYVPRLQTLVRDISAEYDARSGARLGPLPPSAQRGAKTPTP